MAKGFFDDVAKALNGRQKREGSAEVGDGAALYSCGGPHFAPINPNLGDTFYCAISEVAYVYAEDVGQSGWQAQADVAARPAMVEKENQRIKDGLEKLVAAQKKKPPCGG